MFKKKDEEKVFVIVANTFMGDVLLSNSLVQNIKRIYPKSKVVILTNPANYDTAKYLEGVDDVIVWDRKGKHKGVWATFKFVFTFPYRNVFAAFPMYASDRFIILSFLLRAKYILFYDKKNILSLLRSTKYDITCPPTVTVQERQSRLLSGLTKEELIDVPIRYNPPEVELDEYKDAIALCCVSSKPEKDMDIETASRVIEKLSDRKILFLGSGDRAKKKYEALKHHTNLVDLVDKTSIVELAQILKTVSATISVDTGTLHLACAVQSPVVGLFYQSYRPYQPEEKLYNIKVLSEEITPEKIIDSLNML